MMLYRDELALLRCICDHPDDDTPRLVYADWLDDQGDAMLSAHAEIIRIQVKFAREDVERTDEFFTGGNTIHGLFLKIVEWEGSDWSAGNALSMRLMGRTIGGTGYTRPERWDRGFPEVVTFPSVAAYHRSAGYDLTSDRLYERVPVLRTRVKGRRPHMSTRTTPSYCWWTRATASLRRPADLPELVFDQLGVINEFRGRKAALHTAWLAFTDAGRVRCGLSPRFKGVAETKKEDAA